ncbi:hypothetical protein HDV02_002213 [Globomyces sp. JEL0801]|nr:hypothetical protein HDV02_002213 [Globomyces sp. JEL0801]
MLFQFLTLASSALCLAVDSAAQNNFITGDIYFADDCKADLQVNQYRRIVFGEKYRPKDATKMKLLWWNYPAKEIKLDFYANDDAKTPYATITPTGQYFLGSACGWTGPQVNENSFTINTKRGISGEYFFLTQDSYVVASRSNK